MKKRFLFSFFGLFFFQLTDFSYAMVDSGTRLEIIVWLAEGNIPREMKTRQRFALKLLQEFEEMVSVAEKDLSFLEQWCIAPLLGGCCFYEYFSYDFMESEKNQKDIEEVFKQAGAWSSWQEKIYDVFQKDSSQDIYLKKLEKYLFSMFDAIIGDFATCTAKRVRVCQDFENRKNMREGSVSLGYAFCHALEKFLEQARKLLDLNGEKCSLL